jgi:pyruvate dehydrogenase E1 component alpha subunit
MSDPAKYREKDEVEEMKSGRDPIDGIKKRMMEEHGIDEADLKAIDKEIKAIVKESAEFAESSPELGPEELWTDVLVEV